MSVANIDNVEKRKKEDLIKHNLGIGRQLARHKKNIKSRSRNETTFDSADKS